MAKIKLVIPENYTPPEGIAFVMKDGMVEIEESEALNYYQLGFYAPPDPVVQKSKNNQQAAE